MRFLKAVNFNKLIELHNIFTYVVLNILIGISR